MYAAFTGSIELKFESKVFPVDSSDGDSSWPYSWPYGFSLK